MMDSTDFGETIRMNSALTAATEYLSSEGEEVDDTDEMDFKVRGGNSRIVNALARKIGVENIRTEHVVVGIHQISQRVDVYVKARAPHYRGLLHLRDSRTLHDRHRLGKATSKEKLEAAAQLQYARITKTAVLCSNRFWPDPPIGGLSVCTNLASDFCFDSTFGQRGTTGNPLQLRCG